MNGIMKRNSEYQILSDTEVRMRYITTKETDKQSSEAWICVNRNIERLEVTRGNERITNFRKELHFYVIVNGNEEYQRNKLPKTHTRILDEDKWNTRASSGVQTAEVKTSSSSEGRVEKLATPEGFGRD
jgi:hypothetical protein